MIARMAVAATLLCASSAAYAADWVERPYDPPVGGRWIVTSETSADEVRASEGSRWSKMKQRAEFTIESKTADGYKVVYVMRDIEIDGNTPGVPIMRSISGIMKDITVRGTVDKTGKPVSIDNLDETRAAMRRIVDHLKDSFKEKPQIAQFIGNMFGQMLILDGARAATTYLESLPQLALGQTTGLKPGELRRSVDESPSPFGGGTLKSNLALQIVKADAATGNVSLLQTTSYDPVSIKEFATNAARQLMVAAGDKVPQSQFDDFVKKIEMTLNGRLEIEVEGGMTRRMRDVTDTRASLMGQTFTKHEVRTVTVTPAP